MKDYCHVLVCELWIFVFLVVWLVLYEYPNGGDHHDVTIIDDDDDDDDLELGLNCSVDTYGLEHLI